MPLNSMQKRALFLKSQQNPGMMPQQPHNNMMVPHPPMAPTAPKPPMPMIPKQPNPVFQQPHPMAQPMAGNMAPPPVSNPSLRLFGSGAPRPMFGNLKKKLGGY